MTAKSIKALVLAAGFGTRLKPLTDRLPKPLFPFCGPSLLDLAIAKIRTAQISEIAVNSHHLGVLIADHFAHHKVFQNIHLSHEPEILGTGGAVVPLRGWLGDSDLLIYSGDIIADIDLQELIAAHRKQQADATMAVLPVSLPEKNPVYRHNQQIVGISKDLASPWVAKASPHTFTSIHILSPQFINRLPTHEFCHIIDTYNEVIASKGKIACYVHDGFWHDMGNPRDYWLAIKDFIRQYSPQLDQNLGGISDLAKKLGCEFSFFPNSYGQNAGKNTNLLAKQVIVEKTANIGPFVAAFGRARIEANAKVSDCLLLDGAHIKKGEQISHTLISAYERISLSS